jgi:hypothetical protein
MSNNTDKIWVDETVEMYPGKFILITDMEFVREGNSGRYFGYIQGVYNTRDEARAIRKTINQTSNQTMIIEGYE